MTQVTAPGERSITKSTSMVRRRWSVPRRLDILALSEQAAHAHLEGQGREPIDDEISVEREGDALGDEVEGEE